MSCLCAKVPNAWRKGATLIEVLVAMFVMSIGMVTLLALFPLGILSMAQAIKDDRCALAAGNAAGIEIAWDFRHGSPFLSAASPPTNYSNYYNPTPTRVITSLTQTGGTATATLAVATVINNGASVTIAGVVNDTAYNGSFTVNVLSTTQFTYTTTATACFGDVDARNLDHGHASSGILGPGS